MKPDVELFRLAIRTVATGADTADVVFYLAEPSTMDDALEMARFPRSVLDATPGLFEKLTAAFESSLDDMIEKKTGGQYRRAGWRRRHPLESPEGRA